MKKLASTSYILLLAFALGCSHHRSSVVHLATGGSLKLATPSARSEGTAYSQFMRIERQGQRFEFEAQVEAEPERLAVIGMTPVGSRGFAAIWERDQIQFEHIPFYRLPVSPTALLSAWQLAFLPVEDLAPSLAQAGAQLETNEAGTERIYRRNARIWARVRFREKQSTLIEYLGQGFSLEVTTRSQETYALP